MFNDVKVAVLYRAAWFSGIEWSCFLKPLANCYGLLNRRCLHFSNLISWAIRLVRQVYGFVALASPQRCCIVILLLRRIVNIIPIKRLVLWLLAIVDVLCPSILISTFIYRGTINAPVWRWWWIAGLRWLTFLAAFNFFKLYLLPIFSGSLFTKCKLHRYLRFFIFFVVRCFWTLLGCLLHRLWSCVYNHPSLNINY